MKIIQLFKKKNTSVNITDYKMALIVRSPHQNIFDTLYDISIEINLSDVTLFLMTNKN